MSDITTKPFPTTLRGPVTVGEFDWEANNMDMRYLKCNVHPGTKYLTKHVWQRSIHVISDPNKCDCLLSSLIVTNE
jgi:hypothetical protein